MDRFELQDAHLCINLCSVEAGMAQQLLDISDIGPVFQHVRGARVPE
jgi:hypothetical protein